MAKQGPIADERAVERNLYKSLEMWCVVWSTSDRQQTGHGYGDGGEGVGDWLWCI